MHPEAYQKSIELLYKASSPAGFLASAQEHSNYKRVWARDGVICGLAALASGDPKLISTFAKTLETLAKNQHKNGTIPSNVLVGDGDDQVSYGGLAGRVDAVTWFIIGVCQYAIVQNDATIVAKYKQNIERCLQLMEAWEFNNKHLIYTPLSGNWADEYIVEGYVLYDQLLRIWALKSYNHFACDNSISEKIASITSQIEINFTDEATGEKYHEKAYKEANITEFMPCCFSPAGYKTPFDAFGNSLALLLNIGNAKFQDRILSHFESVLQTATSRLIPAFWPPISPTDPDWNLLRNNCKYEFRNYPNEFHNGGIWPMVNGFYGLALLSKNKNDEAEKLLNAINEANEIGGFAFYENFNSATFEPNGVPFCSWSAAAAVLLDQSINHNFKFFT